VVLVQQDQENELETQNELEGKVLVLQSIEKTSSLHSTKLSLEGIVAEYPVPVASSFVTLNKEFIIVIL